MNRFARQPGEHTYLPAVIETINASPTIDQSVAASDLTQWFEDRALVSSAKGLSFGYQDAVEAANNYARLAKSPATVRAYRSDIRVFAVWCQTNGLRSLPADIETIAAFLAHEARRGIKTRTIERRVAALKFAHELGGMISPTSSQKIRSVMSGIRRDRGRRPAKKSPILVSHLESMLSKIPDTFIGCRDRALLLIGFAGALRRSELCSLEVEDMIDHDKGLVVTIRKSKTDQEGEGQTIVIPRGQHNCPVAALKQWLEWADIKDGPIFRRVTRYENLGKNKLNDRTVARIVKLYAAKAGLKPEKLAGHSLRAGVITSAAMKGKNLWKLRELSRHASLDMLREYVRSTELFDDAATEQLL